LIFFAPEPVAFIRILAEYAEDIYETGPIQERVSSILKAAPLVFTDIEQQLLLLQSLIPGISDIHNLARRAAEAFYETDIAPSIPDVFPPPRFRGVVYETGYIENGQGKVAGMTMNPDDWVFFAIGGTGGWTEDYVYQWTVGEVNKWEPRARPSQTPTFCWLYLDAVSSAGSGMTGTDLGFFSDVFCQALVATRIFVTELYLQGGTIRENGYIQSGETDPVTGKPLLLINKDGIEAINGRFIDGFFSGRVEADEGFFRGLLETPALRSSTETIYSTERSYAAGVTVQYVIGSERTFWGIGSSSAMNKTLNVSGTFRGQAIKQLVLYDTMPARPLAHGDGIFVTFDNGDIEELWDLTQLPVGGLSFRRITSGWNIQMRNLPISDPKIENVVWRNGNQLMISTG
jgi:hypothetical protein